MKRIRAWQLGATIIIFVGIFLVGVQNAMAVSFDYYSHMENPPVTRHSPPLNHIKKDLKGKLGEVHLRFPVELAKKGLNTLQSSVSVKTLIDSPVEFIVEQYQLVSENGNVTLYPRYFDKDIKEKKMTVKDALTKLSGSTYTSKPKYGGPNFTFQAKGYDAHFKQLTLNIRVKIMYQGQEEIIEDSIPLYRGRYTFGFFEYLKGQFYE